MAVVRVRSRAHSYENALQLRLSVGRQQSWLCVHNTVVARVDPATGRVAGCSSSATCCPTSEPDERSSHDPVEVTWL
jgi:hypothetical protein